MKSLEERIKWIEQEYMDLLDLTDPPEGPEGPKGADACGKCLHVIGYVVLAIYTCGISLLFTEI